MRNLLLALGAGVIVLAALFASRLLGLGEASVPAVLVVTAVYYFLARRTFRQVEAIFQTSALSLQTAPPKFELALSTLEKGYAFASQQFGVRSQVDTQMGVILFLKGDNNKALPHLKRSLGFGHWLGAAMLAVIYYKKKDPDEMRKTMDIVVKRAKKQSLAWCLYGYLLTQLGDREAALRVLADGVKKTGDDTKVKEALLAVQNDRKIKMRGYKEQWYQFQLERPPVEYQRMAVGGHAGGKAARRGRWS
ncbi:MAG: hypothetical protein AAB426_01795 [Myxococcota bacterium]